MNRETFRWVNRISIGSILILIVVPVLWASTGATVLFPFVTNQTDTARWGYINKNGDVIVEPIFISATEFSNGVGAVEIENETHGIVNLDGHLTKFPKNVFPTSPFSHGIAVGWSNGQLGLIDKSGKLVTKFDFKVESTEYRNASTEFHGGLASLPLDAGGMDFIDTSGKVVLESSEWFKTVDGFQGGMAAILTNNMEYVVINRMGQVIAGPFRSILHEPSEGLFCVPNNRMVGNVSNYSYINNAGKTVLTIASDQPGRFSEGLATVVRDGKTGYIDKTGNLAIEPKFDWAGDFSEGFAPVKIGTEYGFIGKSGKLKIAPAYSFVNQTFRNGLARVQNRKAFGYIDVNGEWVWKSSKEIDRNDSFTNCTH